MQKKALKTSAAILPAALFIYSLIKSDRIAEGCGTYLRLCGERIIPALFVFSVLSSLICGSKAFYKACSALPRWGTETALLLLGMLGGFPLGAKTAAELYEKGCINKRQAEYLCAFTNNPSLSFTVSYVGGVFGSPKTGIALAALTLVGALVPAVLLRYLFLPEKDRRILPCVGCAESKSLAAALKDSCEAMIIICGCVVFFGSISAVLPESIGSVLELTGGIARCGTATEAAFLLGFSGLSVTCQVAAVCNERLSITPFFVSKLIQGGFMALCAYFLFDF